MTTKRARIWLFIVSVAILPVLLLYPFNADNDIYQWMGLVLVRYHGLPYLSSWDQNFPGIVFIHALAILLGGNSVVSFRAFECVWMLFTLLAILQVSQLWISEKAALIGSVLFLLFYVHGPTGILGQRDFFAILPIALAGYLFVKSHRIANRRAANQLALMAGAMIGVATCLRPTYILLLAAPVLTLFMTKERLVRMSFFVLVGCALPIVLVLIPFVLHPDGSHQLYLSIIRFNADVYSPIHTSAWRFSIYVHDLLTLHVLAVIILSVIWMVAFLFNRWRKQPCVVKVKTERYFLALYFLTLLIGMFSMQALANYHFLPFYALFMPVLAEFILEEIALFKRWKPMAVAVVVVAILVLLPWGLVWPFFASGFSLSAAHKDISVSRRDPAQDAVEAASYIQRNSKNDDVVEVIDDAGLLWRVNRRAASRFPTLFPLIVQTPYGNYTEYQIQWRQEFLMDLKRADPRFVVLTADSPDSAILRCNTPLTHIPGVSAFLDSGYSFDTMIHTLAIYKRKTIDSLTSK